MRTLRIGVTFLFVALWAFRPSPVRAQTAVPDTQHQTTNATASAPETTEKVTAYTLPPDLYKKARERSRINFHLALIGFIYELIVLLLLLRWRISPAYRTWAEKMSARRFVQAFVFTPLLLLTIAVLMLPLDIYGESVEKRFGISVQSWGSWSWDWIKAQFLLMMIGTIFVLILYMVIRRSDHQGCHGGSELWRGVGFSCHGRGQIQGLDGKSIQPRHQRKVGQALQEAGIRPARIAQSQYRGSRPLHFHSIKDPREREIVEVAESSRPEYISINAFVRS